MSENRVSDDLVYSGPDEPGVREDLEYSALKLKRSERLVYT